MVFFTFQHFSATASAADFPRLAGSEASTGVRLGKAYRPWTNLFCFVGTVLATALLARAFLYMRVGEDRLWADSSTTIIPSVLHDEVMKCGLTPYGLFFGSSTTMNGIDPRVFDSTLRRHGIDTYSFNLGVSGAAGHEVDYLARRTIERLRRNNLPLPSWVIVDLTVPHDYKVLADDFSLIPELDTLRSERWHDFRQTSSLMRAIWRDPSTSAPLKVWSMALHTSVFLRRNFALSGKWRPFVYSDSRGRYEEILATSLTEQRGYLPYNSRADKKKRRTFLEREIPGYLEQVRQKVTEHSRTKNPGRDYNHEAVRAQANYFRELGIHVVYIVTPIHVPTPHVDVLLKHEDLPPFLLYDRPDVYPVFFDPVSRQDSGHLANEAVPHFTELLAEDFVALRGDIFISSPPNAAPSHPG